MKKAFGIAAVWGVGCIDNSIPMAELDTGEPAAMASDAPDERSLAAADQPRSTPEYRGSGSANNDAAGTAADGEWCGVHDLQMVAEMRHEDGEPAAVGYPTQSHRLWFRVANPCETAVELETLQGCLVEGWRAAAGAISASASFPCGGESGIRRIEPGVADPETGERMFVGTDYTVLSRSAR